METGTLNKENVENILALTPMQEGMLFHYLKTPGSDYYFEQLSLEISGAIDKKIFEKAWNFVIKTNEMLRAVFRWEKVDNPVQIILKEYQLQPRYCDFTGKASSDVQNQLEEIKVKDREHKFDLQEVPLRVILGKMSQNRYHMLISNHHILYDGWSTGIILKEFSRAYESLAMGSQPLVPLVKPGFKEFIQWHQEQDRIEQKKYWQNYLEGFYTPTRLPIKRSKAGPGYTGERNYRLHLSQANKDKLEVFVKERRITLAAVFYCAWGVLLQKYCGLEDVVFGITVSGRSAPIRGIENMVGLFINTIPLRVRSEPGENWLGFLVRINSHMAAGEKYENTPLVDIYSYCRQFTQASEELFDSLVSMENYPLDSYLKEPGSHLSIQSYSMEERPHYDLNLVISTTEGIDIDFIYKNASFDKETVVRLAHHFSNILKGIVENIENRPQEIEILSGKEKQQLLVDFNRTAADYPREKTICRLFEEQVEWAPDHVAFTGPKLQNTNHKIQTMRLSKRKAGAKLQNTNHKQRGVLRSDFLDARGEIQLSYGLLNEESNCLAYTLLEKGVQPDTIVGIMIERSMEMIIGILGILKAGGAYLPIDPGYPQERINYMLADSSAKILVTSLVLSGKNEKLLIVNCQGKSLKKFGGGGVCLNPQLAARSLQLAYVIYTSGSTGRPKGVMIEHKAVHNFFAGMAGVIEFKPGKIILALTTITFDIFGLETLLPLCCGLKVVLADENHQREMSLLEQLVVKNCVDMVQATPGRMQMFTMSSSSRSCLRNLKELMVGGEALPGKLLAELKQSTQAKIYNMYGPTETTIWSTVKDLSGAEKINIGTPIRNTVIYIFDKYYHIQPVGVPGELCIGGDGLARGYINQPQLTAEKFDRDLSPKQKGPGKNRMQSPHPLHSPIYRTGDLARWQGDGNIEFLGRNDHQVKIRGFRIELGEIENRLTGHKDIKEAVAVVREDAREEKHLFAFIIAGRDLVISELKTYLAGKLPAYMIPAYFRQIERIPLTRNGKIDRKALMSTEAVRDLETGGAYVPPASEIEKTIAGIWKELLETEKISVHDNFFDAGGNSLSIIRLNSRLKKAFARDIPMAAMFTYPTISAMAAYLRGSDKVKAEPGPGRETQTGKTGLEIAIIGMSCRFPGAKNIHEYWENIKNGIESIVFFSKEELNQWSHGKGLLKDRHQIPAKGILAGKEYFDAAFFDYTPAEAAIMDPQMRIFHEICREALEDAGYDPGTYDRRIGLYAGASSNPLWEILPLSPYSDYSEQWGAFQLSDKDYTSTRIGYKLGLKGPCITLQTACSTSLAAVDLAGQGLLNHACEMSLAGGISITMHDETGYRYREGAIMSRDGHCRPFDARAAGTLGGNGAGAVVLKSLEQAIRDRDHIYAVIKSTAVNNDGKNKVGYTAPGVEGQADVIRTAIQKAGIEPGSIGYIETHGTGTGLGDPIEIEGLKQAFMSWQGASSYGGNTCALGSVKANIGHLDAAAGIAGLIKTIMAIKNGLIPPNLHFETINPDIDLENTPFYINTRLTAWKNDGYPRRAGVSSFGIGGTNAHVILEEAPGGTRGLTPLSNRQYQLILLSAKTPSALDKMTENLTEYFKKSILKPGNHENPAHPGQILANAAYTLQVGRKTFKYRRKLICSHVNEAIEALSSSEPWKVNTFFSKEENISVIFMFSGLGSQYVNMGLELYRTEPVFHEEMDRCFEILNSLMDYNIKEILYPGLMSDRSNPSDPSDLSDLSDPLIASIVIFIIEYTLARLLMRWGIIPKAMIGYSFGEYAAACLAGVFSLENALEVIVYRGKLLSRVPGGAMLSVPLSHTEVTPLLTSELSIAIDNGLSCIVAGPGAAIAAFEKKIKQKKLMCMPVTHSLAMHSQMVEPILAEFEKKLKNITLNPPQIPYISNVTGTWLTAAEAVTPGYWVEHLRKTVRFAEGIRELMKYPYSVFIELGPARDLSSMVKRFTDDNTHRKILNLIPPACEKVSDVYYLLNNIGNLWLYGGNIHWAAIHRGEERHRIPLPTYPFEGKPFPVQAESLSLSTPSTGKQAHQESLTANRQASVSDWFYTPVWELALPDANKKSASPDGDYCLVFIDETGFGKALIRHLREMKNHAAGIITVRIGSAYSGVDRHQFIIDPKQGNDYDRLFLQLKEWQNVPGKIVHLWAISGESSQDALKNYETCLERGFFSILEIVQALGRQHITGKIRVEVITNGIHEVTGEEFLQPAAAAIRAAIKVIPLEYDNISCRGIDIVKPLPGSVKEAELVSRLARELTLPAEYPGNIAAIRGNHCWVQTMKPIPLEHRAPIPKRLKQGGVYLVTGGLGGIGLTLAEYLAKSITAKLILLGRTPLPGKEQWDQWLSAHEKENNISLKIDMLRRMEAAGAEVMVAAADITDAGQMDRVMSRALEKFKTIDGILHAAGIADTNGIIQARTREMTETVLAPKVKGTMVLDRLLKLKKIEPDFIVLFSSLANVAPEVNFGQLGYSAANEFLDAYACYKTSAEGIFTVSINWPAWEEKGMWAKVAAQWHEKSKNIDNPAFQSIFANTLSPLQGIDVFCRILDSPPLPLKRAAVSPVDLTVFVRQCRALRTAVKQEIGNKDQNRRQKHPRPELFTPYAAPGSKTQHALVDLFQEFFGIEKIGIRDNFFELGGDSLKAVNLAARIHKNLDIEIPLTEFFNRPTIETLAQYIREKLEINPYASIGPVEKKDYYELSSAQKRLFIIRQMDTGSTVYNCPFIFMLEGNLKIEKFERVIRSLISRHESFRTCFLVIDGQPVQRIKEEVEVKVEVEERDQRTEDRGQTTERRQRTDDRQQMTEFKQAAHLSSVIRHLSSEFIRPFDLSQAPLLRIGLIKKETQRHILMLDMHHIISDGMSINVLVQDFFALYTGEELSELKVRYKDYAQWQNRERVSKRVLEQGEYWKKVHEGEIPVLELPNDYVRPVVRSFEGDRITFEINKETSGALQGLALGAGATLYMVLLSLYTIFLSKLSSQEEILIGSPLAGRRHADLEKIIGMFVHTVALRNYPSGEKRFTDFLEEVKEKTLKAFKNQEYQYEDMVENLAVTRDLSRNPLFDTMFVLQNFQLKKMEIPGLELIPFEYENKTAKFDLTLTVMEVEEKLLFTFEYSTKLFREETINRFIGYLKNIMGGIIKNKDRRISDFEIITGEEKRRILFEFNDTEAEYPKNKTIYQLFEEQAAKTPDHIALIGSKLQNTNHKLQTNSKLQIPNYKQSGDLWADVNTLGVGHLSYLELNESSSKWARVLIEKGVQPDTIVGIMMERSVEMVMGILVILKARGAYLPIDPDYPQDRINYMLKDSGAKILLTASEVPGLYSPQAFKICPKSTNSINNYQLTINNSQLKGNSLAYIIYTSGTTGQPKGSLVEHRNVVRLLFNDKFQFDFTDRDVWTLFHSFCFDFSVWEMYGALLFGGKLLLVPKMVARDTAAFLELLNREAVTVLNQTPSAFYNLINEALTSHGQVKKLYIKYVIFGGETLNQLKLKNWLAKYPRTRLINMFGITETTVHVTYKEITEEDVQLNTGSIGKPIPTLRVYILDRYLKPVPAGVTGEIYVGGDGVVRGYLNRVELTEEKFIENPYKPGDRLYRSGDAARFLENGDMEYSGRIDLQVKIRGYRIELGEIESQLLTYGEIKDAVVLAEETPEEKYLCAYIAADKELALTGLRTYLSGKLPDYMIPSYFVRLEKIPLTSNGKVDRKALPKPGLKVSDSYTAPRNEIEKKLAALWSEILGRDVMHVSQLQKSIGIDDNFFELGGHSIKAASLVSGIHKELSVKIPLEEVFKSQTIRRLSEYIRESKEVKYTEINNVEAKEYYPLSSSQGRLYFIHRLSPGSTAYNMPQIVGLEGVLDIQRLQDTFNKLITRHESLRTSFDMIDGLPVQRIAGKITLTLEFHNLKSHESIQGASRNQDSIIKDFIRPFDLSKSPLIRAGIIKTGEKTHILMADMHHIINDGISMNILIPDFMDLYAGKDLPRLRLQYKDFSGWEKKPAQKAVIKKQEEYWLKELSGELPVVKIPTDFPKPGKWSYKGGRYSFEINEKETGALREMALREGATINILLLAIYTVLLSKLSGQEDIVVAIASTGRRHADLEHIIGMFLNMLLIRNYPGGEKSFNDFLREVRLRMLDVYDNQDYQFEELVEKLKINVKREMNQHPLCNVQFGLQNMNMSGIDIPGLKLVPYRFDNSESKVDMLMLGTESEEKLDISIEYNMDLFKEETIRRFGLFFKNIVTGVIENPDRKIKEIEVLFEEEKNGILLKRKKNEEAIRIDFDL